MEYAILVPKLAKSATRLSAVSASTPITYPTHPVSNVTHRVCPALGQPCAIAASLIIM